MTQEEIRKLLGGYATDRLTADERRILFEAALEDQALFNALQNEDALRELLDDPVARNQVRRLLAGPLPKRRPHFGSRRWVFGVALPAVAAVILIVILDRAMAPRPTTPPVQIATNEIAPSPKLAPPQPAEAKTPAQENAQAETSARPARVAPAPLLAMAPRLAAPQSATPGPSAPIAQLESPRAAVASLRVGSPERIPDAVRQQFSEALVSTAPLYQGPLVRYSVARGRHDGNAVRVNVSTSMPGYLALYRVDAAGNVKRVYPTADVATPVLPNIAMQIPINPVKVDAGEKLRLVVIPLGEASVFGQLGAVGGVVNGAATTLGTGNAPLEAPRAPLVVDIPLGPN
jgi:hypothetical protein